MEFSEEYVIPVRFHTRGYTGDKSHDCRDSFRYEEHTIHEAIITSESFVSALKTPESIDPFEFAQFVRGELFVLVDSLLTSHFTRKQQQNAKSGKTEVESVLGLCEVYCVLYEEWLKVLPKLYSAVHLLLILLVYKFSASKNAVPNFTLRGDCVRGARIHGHAEAVF